MTWVYNPYCRLSQYFFDFLPTGFMEVVVRAIIILGAFTPSIYIHYRSYLNVQTLLREFEVNVPEWDTKITLNVNSSSYWDAIEMREKPRGDITRYVRIRNVIGDCCEKCGASEGLEIHHILPKSVAIDDCVHNLQLLCKNCHTEVHWSMQRNPIPYNVKVAMEA